MLAIPANHSWLFNVNGIEVRTSLLSSLPLLFLFLASPPLTSFCPSFPRIHCVQIEGCVMFSKNYPASDIQYSILNETLAQWYVLPPLTHQVLHPFTHSPIHPFTHSPIHSFTHSPIYSFAYPPIRLLILLVSSHSGRVSIPAFYIDQYPVTNAEFKQFLDASNYKPADPHNFLLVFNALSLLSSPFFFSSLL